MRIAVERIDELGRKLTVTVPAETVEKEIDNRLRKESQRAKIKGFRDGKVPLDVVRMHYGEAIRGEVMNELIRNSFYEALQQEKLNIAGMPQITPKGAMLAGTPLEYEATFEVYPEFTLHDLAKAEVEKLNASITDADVVKTLEKLQQQHVEWVEVNRAGADKDRLVIDFEGFMNGEKFAGGSAKEVGLVLGSNSMIPGFEEGLVGAKAGDTRELNLTFPENYQHKDLAGKAAKFEVKVNKVYEPKLPELNDAFAEKLDIKEGMEKLKAEVRKSMEMELQRAIQAHTKQQVLTELVKRNPITVPNALIDAEIEQMAKELQQRFGAQMKGAKLPQLPREYFAEQAKQRVVLGLLFAELIKQQQLKADAARVRAKIEELASSYDNPEQVINHYYQNQSILSQIEALVLEEQAVEKLLEAAQIKEKTVSYEDALKADSNTNATTTSES